MAEKTLNARIVHKHDIEENWLKATNFIPKQGEMIIYDTDKTYTYERFKIGDGTTNVNELPFATDFLKEQIETLPAVLTTAQELTDEQRTQARANVSTYGNVWTKITNPNMEIADYNAIKYNSPTFDMESALNQPSSVNSRWSSITAIAFYGETMIGGGTPASILKMAKNVITDFEVLRGAGTLSSTTLSIAKKDAQQFPDEIGFAMSIRAHIGNVNGFAYTHVITISAGRRTGTIYYSIDTESMVNGLTVSINTDQTLSQESWAADAKAVGDALALKADLPTEDDAMTLLLEMGIIEPTVAEDGSVFTNENGAMYTLI